MNEQPSAWHLRLAVNSAHNVARHLEDLVAAVNRQQVTAAKGPRKPPRKTRRRES